MYGQTLLFIVIANCAIVQNLVQMVQVLDRRTIYSCWRAPRIE